MATVLRHPRPGIAWDWWAVDTEGFPVRFSCDPAPEHLLAHVDRVDAAAAWAEDNCPAWSGPGPRLPPHAFDGNGRVGTCARHGLPDAPLRPSDAPAAVAAVAAPVEPKRSVGDTWTIHLDEGWLQAAE
ncbi:hypothetical protein [Kitasatospora sp. NPDC001527]|uniref:hypothetical protein n=1 Tax=Kitasatospora sp. NPDC001527 TaxID=3154519 RepID=UPI00332C6702